MHRLASDADVRGEIVRGLLRQRPDVDLVRSQDVLPLGTPDPEVLAWAASENRLLITNDRNTMSACVADRLAAGERVPGVIITLGRQSAGGAIEDILIIAECATEEDFRRDPVIFLPLTK